MSDLWYSFDPLDADERAEQQILETEIAAAERAALDAIRQLVALVDRHGETAHRAGSVALAHISTVASATLNGLNKRTLERDELRRRRLAR